MTILHIEHPIRDFDTWKKAFESDPAGREKGGVRSYQVFRPIDDPNYVMIDLNFDSSSAAKDFLAAMREVWQSPSAGPALAGTPQTRIIEVVESKEY
jgi:ribosomal protein L35AE/L33A